MTGLPSPRTELDLAAASLRAIELWHRARREVEEAARAPGLSREERMDLDRRLEVLQVQHDAIVERTQAGLVGGVHLLRTAVPPRAVVAHRNEWFADKVCGDLVRRGAQVVARSGNGAEAVGIAVAEQPDLVLVEDRLAMTSGTDVVREVRRFVPAAVIAAQVAYDDDVAAVLAAGATAAYPRRLPPLEVAADLSRLLAGELLDA